MIQSFFSLEQIDNYAKFGSISVDKVYCSETDAERISLESIYGLTENQSKIIFEYFITISLK
jgi:hypothetical protein